jgi:1,4-dihydroxy-2-naphthoate octaprenyltransferase
MITAGLLLPGAGYFVMKGAIDVSFLLFLPSMLLYGLAFIINVEIPDMEADSLGKKNTVIVRKGRKFGFFISGLALSSATFVFFALYLFQITPFPFDLRWVVILSIIPFTSGLINLIRRPVELSTATKLVNANITSFILFLLLINLFFFYNLL